MKFVFSNIFLTIFCKNYSLQKYHNSKTFFRGASFNDDKTLILSDLNARIVYFLEATTSLFIKKLPLTTENGGIFSCNVR